MSPSVVSACLTAYSSSPLSLRTAACFLSFKQQTHPPDTHCFPSILIPSDFIHSIHLCGGISHLIILASWYHIAPIAVQERDQSYLNEERFSLLERIPYPQPPVPLATTMQLAIAALLAMVAGVPAIPPSVIQDLQQSAADNDTAYVSPAPCGGLMRKAVCCRKSILGLIDLGCKRASPDIHTGPELAAACEAKGKAPRCCILGLLGIYGPCKPPYATFTGEQIYYDDQTDDEAELFVTDSE